MSLYSEIGITPSFFGLPARFTAFRAAQLEAIDYAVYDCQKRFTGLCLQTGSGKSLLGMAIARALGVKAVYLTKTRALQDQVGGEFAEIGVVDVRGKSNYSCGQVYFGERRQPSCEYGQEHDCSLAHSPDCAHFAAVARATDADIAVTNYSAWLHSRKYDRNWLGGARGVGLLICDEAGEIPEVVSDFVAVKISFDDEELPFEQPRPRAELESGIMPAPVWVTWAEERARAANAEISRIRGSYVNAAAVLKDDRHKYLVELIVKCAEISKMDSNWVWEVDRAGVSFQPIWPGTCSSALWSGVPRIVLMSATLRPYGMQLCGLGKDSYDYREWTPVFLPQLGPVYHLSAGVKLSWRSSDDDYAAVVAKMDEILDARADRRALVHTVSYPRARQTRALSRHAGRIIVNEDGRGVNAAVQQLREGPDDGVLVTPSCSTGFDFPDDQCEVQIVMKMPYPNTQSRVMQERCKVGDYRMHKAVQELVQMAGRARRHPTDRAETFIIDDGVKWAMGGPRNPWHGHAPAGFRVHSIDRMPTAPPRARSRSKINVDIDGKL